jgi:hypothetical protein
MAFLNWANVVTNGSEGKYEPAAKRAAAIALALALDFALAFALDLIRTLDRSEKFGISGLWALVSKLKA